MYNGIGLPTPRGSGTNGYVQRNFALVRNRKEKVEYKTDEDFKQLEAATNKKPNQDILDHERKRKIEVKCVELKELMEEQGGYTPNEIERKVGEFRQLLMDKEGVSEHLLSKDEFGRPDVCETHQVAEANMEKNQRLREAFGISKYFVEGSSLDPSRKEKEKAAAIAAQKTYQLIRDDTPSPDSEKPKKKKIRKRSTTVLERSENSGIKKLKKHRTREHKKDRSTSPSQRRKKKTKGKHKQKKSNSVARKSKKKRKHSSSDSDASKDLGTSSDNSWSQNSIRDSQVSKRNDRGNSSRNTIACSLSDSSPQKKHAESSSREKAQHLSQSASSGSDSSSLVDEPQNFSDQQSRAAKAKNIELHSSTKNQSSASAVKQMKHRKNEINISKYGNHRSPDSSGESVDTDSDSSSSLSSSSSSSSSPGTLQNTCKWNEGKSTHAVTLQTKFNKMHDQRTKSKRWSISTSRSRSHSKSPARLQPSKKKKLNISQSRSRSASRSRSRSHSKSYKNKKESFLKQRSPSLSPSVYLKSSVRCKTPHSPVKSKWREHPGSRSRFRSKSVSRSPEQKRSSSSSSRSLSFTNRPRSRSQSASPVLSCSSSYRSRTQSSYSRSRSRSHSGSNRRSPSIPRRRGSPSFLDKRRITRMQKCRDQNYSSSRTDYDHKKLSSTRSSRHANASYRQEYSRRNQ